MQVEMAKEDYDRALGAREQYAAKRRQSIQDARNMINDFIQLNIDGLLARKISSKNIQDFLFTVSWNFVLELELVETLWVSCTEKKFANEGKIINIDTKTVGTCKIPQNP